MTERRDGLIEREQKWGDLRVGAVIVPGHRRNESWEVTAIQPSDDPVWTGWFRIRNLATDEETSVEPKMRFTWVTTLIAPTKFPLPPELPADGIPAARLMSERLGAALVGVIDTKSGEVWAPWPIGEAALREHLAELHGIRSEETDAETLQQWHVRAHEEQRFNGAREHKHARLEDFTESRLTS